MKRLHGEIADDDDEITAIGNNTELSKCSAPLVKRPRLQEQQCENDSKPNQKLCELLSFWLSGSNLSKDQYLLTQLTSEGIQGTGWTPIRMFLTFNKVQSLNIKNIHEITDALSCLTDPLIEIDSNNERFRFKGGIQVLRNRVSLALQTVSDCTLFLTRFPHACNRNDVMNVFSRYGCVRYVSVPKSKDMYKRNTEKDGKGGGFAFVEMGDSKEAKFALKRWRNRKKVGKNNRRNKRKRLNEQNEENIVEEEEDDQELEDEAVRKLDGMQVFPHTEWLRRKESRKKKTKEKQQQPQAKNRIEKNCEPNRNINNEERKEEETKEQIVVTNIKSKIGNYDPGIVIRITGLLDVDVNNDMSKKFKKKSRNVLYEEMEEFGPVSFIEFNSSSDKSDICYVRFLHESGAQRAQHDLNIHGLPRLGLPKISVITLCGQVESDYWKRVQQEQHQKRNGKVKSNVNMNANISNDSISRRANPKEKAITRSTSKTQ